MDVAIALGQAAGIGTACGILALVPLALVAVAALLLGFGNLLEGARHSLDDGPVVVILVALGLADAGGELRLPERAQIGLRAVAGAVAGEMLAGDEIPIAGLVIGLVTATLAGIVGVRIAATAARAGSSGAASVLAAGGALMVAVLALIPFVGYALAVAAAFLAFRLGRPDGEKYAGLRVLR